MMSARQYRDRAAASLDLGRRTLDPEVRAAFAAAARDWLALADVAEVQDQLRRALASPR